MKQTLVDYIGVSMHVKFEHHLTLHEQLTLMERIRKELDHQFLLTADEINMAAGMDDAQMARYFGVLQELAEITGERRADFTMHQPCCPVVPSIGHTTCSGTVVFVNIYGITVEQDRWDATPDDRVAWVCRWHARLTKLGYSPILRAGNGRMSVGVYTLRFDAQSLSAEVQKANAAFEAVEAEGVLRPHSEPTRRHTF